MTDSIRQENVRRITLADYTKFVGWGKSGVCKILLLFMLPFTPLSAEPLDSRGRSRTLLTEDVARMEEFHGETAWESDYETAMQRAKASSRNLLIYFVADTDTKKLQNETEESFVSGGDGNMIRQVAYIAPSQQKPLPIALACKNFEQDVLDNMDVMDELSQYVPLKLSINATTMVDGKKTLILALDRFKEMQSHPGLAVIDFEHRNADYYGELVGILPFLRAKSPTSEQALSFLTLPPGTLSQRTLIYAVRTHPERPRSAMGQPETVLLDEAGGHSAYQAKIRVLGHQNFSVRSARIARTLNCAGASEICAQSWSGEGLYEAAIGCVQAWRTSSGHWNGVRTPSRLYGYDMVKGGDGIWYATGFFIK